MKILIFIVGALITRWLMQVCVSKERREENRPILVLGAVIGGMVFLAVVGPLFGVWL